MYLKKETIFLENSLKKLPQNGNIVRVGGVDPTDGWDGDQMVTEVDENVDVRPFSHVIRRLGNAAVGESEKTEQFINPKNNGILPVVQISTSHIVTDQCSGSISSVH
jgi:hypothetical protein